MIKHEIQKLLTLLIIIFLLTACGGGGSSGGGASKSIMPSASALKSNQFPRIQDGDYTLYSVFDQMNDSQNCIPIEHNQREKTQVITVTVSGSTCMATSAVHDPAKKAMSNF